MAEQLQVFLMDNDYLDPLQSRFRPSFKISLALVALMDDLYQEIDRGNCYSDLATLTIDHSILHN